MIFLRPESENMTLKLKRGGSQASRFATKVVSETTKTEPEKNLMTILKKQSGRDVYGHVSTRHQGGRNKRFQRLIDFKRDKKEIEGRVISFEYDPNRSANIALIFYQDGEKRYILTPDGLKIGDKIISSENAEVKIGNSLPVKKIPIGTFVHNVELLPGKGGQIARSAGSGVVVYAKEGKKVQLKMPSRELRLVPAECYATIGIVGNLDWKNRVLGLAGRKRHLGIKPTVRGTAQDPRSHPHGGGEGRSGEGMKYPKTPWGKNARGKRTRKKKKYSNKFIIQRRK